MKRTCQSSLLGFLKKSKQNEIVNNPVHSDDNKSKDSLLSISPTVDFPVEIELQTQPSTSSTNLGYPLNDIAIVSKKLLTDEEKFEAIDDLWIPPPSFNFPAKQEGKYLRKFNHKYLEQHKWLTYSVKEDGVYCKFCVFYSKKEVGHTSRQEVGALCKNAFRSWKKCGEKFRSHEMAEYHKQSVLNYLNLKKYCKIYSSQ